MKEENNNPEENDWTSMILQIIGGIVGVIMVVYALIF